jgi:hypothetical protein
MRGDAVGGWARANLTFIDVFLDFVDGVDRAA